MVSIAIIAGVVLLALLGLTALFKAFWKVPRADEALVITGAGIGKGQNSATRSYRVVTGSGALVWPVFQRAQYVSLKAQKAVLGVTGYDAQKVPVGVRGAVVFKVGDSEQEITNAAIRFLDDQDVERGQDFSQMHDLVTEVIHGHLRSIVGGLTIEEIIGDRSKLAAEARDAAIDEITKMGLVIDSLQVQEIEDPTGYIKALGEPRDAEMKARARIAQADRNREAVQAEQAAAVLGEQAKRDADLKRAGFRAQVEEADATAAQAGPLAEAEAERDVVTRRAEVAQQEAILEQRRLEASVNKQADAQAYQTRVNAEAEAQARLTTARADAEATKVRGTAEADAQRAIGSAAAENARLLALAEAEGISARAQALREQGEAVIGQTIAEKMPEIVQAAASAFGSIDQLTVFNGAEGMNQMLTQVGSMIGPLLSQLRGAAIEDRPLNGVGDKERVPTP